MDLGNNIATQLTIVPQTSSAGTVTGTGISRAGYTGCVFVGILGKITGAPDATTVTFALYDASTASGTATAITSASCVVTTTGTRQEINLPLQSQNAYVLAKATVAFSGGTAPYASISGLLVFGGAKEVPV